MPFLNHTRAPIWGRRIPALRATVALRAPNKGAGRFLRRFLNVALIAFSVVIFGLSNQAAAQQECYQYSRPNGTQIWESTPYAACQDQVSWVLASSDTADATYTASGSVAGSGTSYVCNVTVTAPSYYGGAFAGDPYCTANCTSLYGGYGIAVLPRSGCSPQYSLSAATAAFGPKGVLPICSASRSIPRLATSTRRKRM